MGTIFAEYTPKRNSIVVYTRYLLDYKDDDKDDHSLTEKWKLKIGKFLQPRVCSYTFIISA